MRSTERGAGAGRPRRRRKEARPQELVAAGLAEFAERGFARARLEDVARRADVSKGTIYRYFADKEALFLAVVRSITASTLVDAAAAVDRFEGPTVGLLEAVITMFYAKVVDSELKTIVRIIVADGNQHPAIVSHYHDEIVGQGRALLRRIIDRGIARGDIRPGPITDLPEALMAPALMAIVWKLTFERVSPIDSRRFMQAHLDLIRRALVAQ